MSGQHRSRARRGAVVGAILGALEDGPNHGYGIMDKLEGLSEGRWRPSPGSVYPALGRLEHKGLIAEVPDSDPKEFEITDEGRTWLKEKGAALTRDGSPFPSGESHGLRGAVSQLAGAAKQVGRYGSEAQRQAAIELVEATTRKLYASMAEAPAEETETDE